MLFVDQSGQLGGAELCLGDLARLWPGGARVLLLSDGPFAPWLRERGVPVEVLHLPAGLAGLTREAGLARVLGAAPAAWGALRQLRAALAGQPLYLNTPKALLAGVAAGAGGHAVFHLHDLLTPDHFSRSNLRLLAFAANRVRGVIANSAATAAAYRAAGGGRPMEVIPNGFDPTPFTTVPPDAVASLRAELNPGGGPVAAIFGRLARWKGQETLLRAIGELREGSVWVVGDALFTGEDHAYAAALRAMADPARVRFLGFRHDIPALMQAADVIVHCSIAPEPFGRVLVEGMLSGRPVIATQGGGAGEIVGGVGFLTPPGEVGALVTALRELFASATLREELGARGRQRALERYTLPRVLEETTRFVEGLL